MVLCEESGLSGILGTIGLVAAGGALAYMLFNELSDDKNVPRNHLNRRQSPEPMRRRILSSEDRGFHDSRSGNSPYFEDRSFISSRRAEASPISEERGSLHQTFSRDNETCSICQSAYSSTSYTTTLNCQHKFHKNCLVNLWEDESLFGYCYVCREHGKTMENEMKKPDEWLLGEIDPKKVQIDSENCCKICNLSFDDKSCVLLSCLHIFHKDCLINLWNEIDNYCKICCSKGIDMSEFGNFDSLNDKATELQNSGTLGGHIT